MTKKNLVVIGGSGAVSSCVYETINKTKSFLSTYNLIIIDPLPIKNWFYDYFPKLKFIQVALDENNHEEILKPFLNSNSIMLDLSVNCDCIFLAKLAQKFGSIYYNTSLENWGIKDTSKLHEEQFQERTLYARYHKMKKIINKKSTVLIDGGQNPGMVNLWLKYALDTIAKEYGSDKTKKDASDEKFANVAENLGLKICIVSEEDTQKTIKAKPKKMMWNTWSAVGLYAGEMLDPVMITNSKLTKKVFEDEDFIIPTSGPKNVMFINKRGCDLKSTSYILDENGKKKKYKGYTIPHGETNSMSLMLKKANYELPVIYYCYKPSDVANETLKQIKKNKYKPLAEGLEAYHVMELPEIKKEGYDCVGLYMNFSGGECGDLDWFIGSLLTVKFVKDVLGYEHCTPTTIQVAIMIVTMLEHLVKNHKKLGLVYPEEVPGYKKILKQCMPYLGIVYNQKI
jgi:homospermidine synthase